MSSRRSSVQSTRSNTRDYTVTIAEANEEDLAELAPLSHLERLRYAKAHLAVAMSEANSDRGYNAALVASKIALAMKMNAGEEAVLPTVEQTGDVVLRGYEARRQVRLDQPPPQVTVRDDSAHSEDAGPTVEEDLDRITQGVSDIQEAVSASKRDISEAVSATHQTASRTYNDVQSIGTMAFDTRKDVRNLLDFHKNDTTEIRVDIKEVRIDIRDLKKEVLEMKKDVTRLRRDFEHLMSIVARKSTMPMGVCHSAMLFAAATDSFLAEQDGTTLVSYVDDLQVID
eukprot:g12832.t1